MASTTRGVPVIVSNFSRSGRDAYARPRQLYYVSISKPFSWLPILAGRMAKTPRRSLHISRRVLVESHGHYKPPLRTRTGYNWSDYQDHLAPEPATTRVTRVRKLIRGTQLSMVNGCWKEPWGSGTLSMMSGVPSGR